MTWYRIDLAAGGSRFVEIDLNKERLIMAINKGVTIQVGRQIMMIPVSQNQLSPALLENISPLVASCHKEKEYLNTSHVIGFGVVDIESDLWGKVREGVLGEAVIATIPNKGLIV